MSYIIHFTIDFSLAGCAGYDYISNLREFALTTTNVIQSALDTREKYFEYFAVNKSNDVTVTTLGIKMEV